MFLFAMSFLNTSSVQKLEGGGIHFSRRVQKVQIDWKAEAQRNYKESVQVPGQQIEEDLTSGSAVQYAEPMSLASG